MTGAKAIVASLEQEGVTTVFGYPGAAICRCTTACPTAQSAIFSFGRSKTQDTRLRPMAGPRRPGVCIATSGPGALNLLTALATAYMDSVPLVAITGQVPSDQLGRDVFQEADITGAAEPFTKHSFLVKNAADIPRIIKEAFYLAGTGGPGPVLIDVPVDVQNQELDFAYPESVSIRGYHPSTRATLCKCGGYPRPLLWRAVRSSAQGAVYSAPARARRCNALLSASASRWSRP